MMSSIDANACSLRLCVSLFGDSGRGVWVRDPEGRTLYMNPAFTRITGFICADLPDLSAARGTLFRPLESWDQDFFLKENAAGGTRRGIRILCKNGTFRDVEMVTSTLETSLHIVCFHDISSTMDADGFLEYSRTLLSLKSRISEIFLTSGKQSGYDSVLAVIREGMKSSAGAVVVMDVHDTLVTLAFDAGGAVPLHGSDDGHCFSRAQRKGKIWQRIMEEQKTCVCNRRVSVPDGHAVLHRVIHAPMVVSGRVMGIISVANKSTAYTSRDKELFTSLASHIAPIVLARLEKEKEEERRKIAEQALNDLNRELENRVNVRSAALVLSNEMLKQEIRERTQIEVSLRESEERYSLAVQGTNDGIWEWNIEKNTVYFSPRWKAIIGYGEDGFPDRYEEWISRIHPEDLGRVLKIRDDCLASGNFFEMEYRLSHKDGSYRWINLRGTCLRDAGGRAVRMAGAHTDITERKEVAREKMALEKQLRHASKLEALGTLTGGVAHDFNNLLQAMAANMYILRTHEGCDQKALHYVHTLDAIIDRASKLVAHLLAFGHRVDPECRMVSINEVLSDSLHLLRSTLPRMIRMETDMDPDPGLIMADPGQLEQIFLNLVNNARDAIDGEGEICIETRPCILHEDEACGLDVAPGPYVRVRIVDTGCGIDDATREHVFEPFFTTKEIGQGTGLGLASVYGIVRSHCGAVICSSQHPRGTRFDLFFPAQTSGAQTVEERANPQAPEHVSALHGDETLLYVDDEDLIAQAAGEMLEEQGYRVLFACCGEDALDIFTSGKETIDLVIMDLGMPGMGGELCARRMLSHDPGIKILVTSGYRNHELSRSLGRPGISGFLSKPFCMEKLLRIIRETLGDGVRAAALNPAARGKDMLVCS